MMRLLHPIDNLLNRITMYKLVMSGLFALVAIAIVFCFTGVLSLSGTGLLLSAGILLTVCYGLNGLLSRLYHVPSNSESSVITALILCCILPPVTTAPRALYIAVAGLVAIASKYVVAWQHKHIFNPAAVGAAFVGITGLLYATWWIGNPSMLPFTLLLGFLIVRKIRRFSLVIAFIFSSLALSAVLALSHEQSVTTVLQNVIVSGPLIFLGTVMLTEPSTMPPIKRYQVLYGCLVGVLGTSGLRLGSLSIAPQQALLAGNFFSYMVSGKHRLRLVLKKKQQIAPNVYDFTFVPDRQPHFRPGQYMEWTLAHPHVDWRGNRRTFSIASSPTEKELHIGVKFYEPGSSFKAALQRLQPGDSLQAGHIAGDFTLPPDKTQKLVWVAGGIGITPFRSMAKYLIDKDQARDIVLFYLVSRPEEKSFHDILEQARQIGLKTVYVLTSKEMPADWHGERGPLTLEHIKRHVPDYAERLFYLSGPNGMVQAYYDQLRVGGVSHRRIVTDYFSGY